jgi:hypothetical protein
MEKRMSVPLSDSIDNKTLSVEDTFDLLNDEGDIVEKPKPEPKPKADEKEPEEEPAESDEDVDGDEEESDEEDSDEDDLKEIEEDLEEVDEEKLELVTPVRRSQILKKFPTLFKEFPYLEKAYYREQQFTEVFPTIDEAKAAAESVQTLQNLEEDIVTNGNTVNMLKLIKEHNPGKFKHVVDSYLENLAEVDPNAHQHVIGNLIRHTVIGMAREARDSQDADLKAAATILHKYVFGHTKLVAPVKLATEADNAPKADTVSEREKALVKQRFDDTVVDLNTKINNSLRNIVELNIDPNKRMSDFVRKAAVRDAMEKIDDLITKDKRFASTRDRLWDIAIRKNFSKDSVDDIRRAHLSKAKSLMEPVTKSSRNEALKGMGKRVREEKEEEAVEEKQPKSTERRRSSNSQPAKPQRKLTTFEELMKD